MLKYAFFLRLSHFGNYFFCIFVEIFKVPKTLRTQINGIFGDFNKKMDDENLQDESFRCSWKEKMVQ